MLYREVDDGSIENIYRLQIMNTSDQTRTFRISVSGLDGIRLTGDDQITVIGGEIGTQTAAVRADPGTSGSGAKPISFDIIDVADPNVAVSEPSKLLMP